MKKITLLMVLLISSLGFSQQQEYLFDFEADGADGTASHWYTFDNDPAPAEIVDNPDLDGVNATASKVMKVVVGPDNAFYAGVNNAWDEEAFGTWKLDLNVASNLTLTMDVNKNYVGTVGIKMGTNSQGTSFQITDQNVNNAVVNEWQTLTFDLSGLTSNNDVSNLSQMVVFVDWRDGMPNRPEGNTIYIDNIKFNAEKLTEPKAVSVFTGNPEGTWKLAAKAGAMGVGPTQGDTGWWSNSDADVTARACIFDDEYVFEANGTFQNVLGDATWLEGWQAGSEGCGTAIAPHNNSNAATWSYDANAKTITITGTGAYLGLPKPNNGGELTAPGDAPNTITYIVSSITETEMTLDLDYGSGFWRFMFTNGEEEEEVTTDPVFEGSWKFASQAGAMGVGPTQGDTGWWSNNDADVTARACIFDDEYVFEANGTFQNVLGTDTWVEGWQNGADGCATPVAPHDNSNAATWSYDSTAKTITITGTGAYLGLAKPNNGGELTAPADAPNSITYIVSSITETEMTLDLDYGSGFWRFVFAKEQEVVVTPDPVLEGSWTLSPQAGAMGVGPTQGDIGWWSNNDADVTARACIFDDEYVFEENGTFQNVLGADTWVEGWQNGADGCATPVAPHDNSNAATWSYDATAGTITITGKGAYLGLAKPHNGGELTTPADAPNSITYIVSSLTETEMTLDLNYGGGFWRFLFTKQSATASIVKNDVLSLKMYPNPASSRLNISAESIIKNAAIFNVLGKQVMSLNINKNSESIDVSTLASGIYLIKYSMNNAIGTAKFIKQ
jgi:hypothetical protein